MTACCYMCWDASVASELIAPCACTSYVHRACLDKWRSTSLTLDAATHCPTCRSPYDLEGLSAITHWLLGHTRVYAAAAVGSLVALLAWFVCYLDDGSRLAKSCLGQIDGGVQAALVYLAISVAVLLVAFGAMLLRAVLPFLLSDASDPQQPIVDRIIHHVVVATLVVCGLGGLVLYLVFSGKIDVFASLKAKIREQSAPRVRNLRPLASGSETMLS
ncbi:hypothetical protein ACHHYP_10240 [Achlya hypogyna]|uniref:Uncharacterized protein n=1 Tax=Achlya hypogyna TaxID=1202772 RepID=A0A1V9YLT2_ACHHY|nr:hypothetical protein ACHHYP_10240 [Achlya hypogyna]